MHPTTRIPVIKIHGTGNVLLVEDDEALARGLVRQITSAGYSVTHVARAADAVERLTGGTFDIVISDLNLPGASGVDVLEVARAYDKDVALVLMTGEPTLDTAIDAVGLGVLEYLVKPTSTEDLVRVLRRASAARRSAIVQREVRASIAPEAARDVDTSPSGARASIGATFDRAMASLAVILEPIVDSRTRRVLGYAARISSEEEALRMESALVVAADRLNRLQDLRRRARDLAVRAFADMPLGTLLFVDVHQSDLMDGDMYSADPPLARIADRVVLQVRGNGGLAIEDLSARASVLRFVGFRLAVTDLEDGACLSQIADLCPEFVKLDAKLVRGLDREGLDSRRKRIVSALVSMCRALDATPIAEGVSSAEEREALASAGCELVQGALVARHSPISIRRPPLAACAER
jgi:EAL domain-containing protein (putative c-di-GMP-specific phosphodiesterase class I)/CheY-like chemotaxis protein